MVECKELEKGPAGYQWNLGSAKGVSMEKFWTWAKKEAIDGSGYPIKRYDRCTYFEKEL